MDRSQREELKSRFKGAFAFAITPFRPDNCMELFEEGIPKNIRYMVERGVHSIVPTAGTGEIGSLGPEEHRKVIELVLDAVKGEALVVPGIPANIKLAIEAAKYAKEAGADAVLPLASESEEGTIRYYEFLADATDIAIMAFNGSGWTPEFVDRLVTKVDKIVAVKDEISNIETFARISDLVGDRVALICGKNHQAKTLHLWFMVGAQGYSCGLLNFIPEPELEIYEAVTKGDYKRSIELQGRIAPLSSFREKAKGKYVTTMVKESMNMIGLAGGSIRPPQLPMPEDEKAELKGLLRKYGLNIRGE